MISPNMTSMQIIKAFSFPEYSAPPTIDKPITWQILNNDEVDPAIKRSLLPEYEPSIIQNNKLFTQCLPTIVKKIPLKESEVKI